MRELAGLGHHLCFSAGRSVAFPPLRFFLGCAQVVSCVGFVLLFFVSQLPFSWCLAMVGKSTLVNLKSKGLSLILRDIRTSSYQICRIEEKINRTTTFHKRICNLTLEARDILKYYGKEEKLLFLLFSTIFCDIL